MRRRRPRRLVAVAALAALAGACADGRGAPSASPSPPSPTASLSPSPPAAGPVPVLLVHGYGGGTAELAALSARIRASGRQTVLVSLPDAGTAGVDASVAALDAAARRTGSARVDVVGYSLGGVVARAWAFGPGRTVARTVVQLASPNDGVVLGPARVGGREVPCDGGNACGQLRPGSPYLRALAAAPWPAGVVVVSIWSTRDSLVRPESAALRGAVAVEIQRVCPDADAGHLAILTDPAAVGAVLTALTPGTKPPLSYPCAHLRRLGAVPPGGG